MGKNAHNERIAFSLAAALACTVTGLAIGYFGLQGHDQFLTWFSACLFLFGNLTFFLGMIYPFKWDGFWYSYVLKRIGEIGWCRRLGINEYAEGAITIAILNETWTVYFQIVVGGGSYVINNLATIPFGIFATSWVIYSAHSLFQKLKGFSEVSKIIGEDQRKVFKERTERTVTWFSKYSLLLVILGGLAFELMSIFLVDKHDKVLENLDFYVTTPWTQPPRFAMVYPLITIPYYFGKINGGLFFGLLALVGGLVLVTAIFFLRITSSEINPVINIYDPECLKPIEDLVNSFWLMTGSGLLLVPLATAFSLNYAAARQFSASRWENYISWTYIVFFVGLFFFSLIKFYAFVSTAKKPVEKRIREELRDALEPKMSRDRIAAARAKMELLKSFKNRPTMTTIVQLAEIVSIIALNLAMRFLGLG